MELFEIVNLLIGMCFGIVVLCYIIIAALVEWIIYFSPLIIVLLPIIVILRKTNKVISKGETL